jgi:hypothetical protein
LRPEKLPNWPMCSFHCLPRISSSTMLNCVPGKPLTTKQLKS